ncbi:MAG: 6,7-dimethyl-8-ribityllumazine synthase [Deltaproteobacteria bacterium]
MRRAAPRLSVSARDPKSVSPRHASKRRIALLRADYNREITLSLEKKCVAGLIEGGVRAASIDQFVVPGCFEIPLAALRLARTKRYDAIIALGAVIRGETYHFDLVANECARGIMRVSLDENIPIIFEVLATYNRRHAMRRAGNNRFNKGLEAAQSALAVLAALDHIKE